MVIIKLILSLFLIYSDSPKQEEQIYITNECFDYWMEYRKLSDSFSCHRLIFPKEQINDSVWTILEYDSASLTTYKKIDNKLVFKNKYNPKYSLYFDFKSLKGGDINYIYGEGSPEFSNYKIVCKKKIEFRGEYLYCIGYEPIGFFSTAGVRDYYYNANGECVMMEIAWFDGKDYFLRTDYFDKALTEEEIERLKY